MAGGSAPPEYLCTGGRVEVLPAAGRADNVCELLVGDAGVNRR